MISRTILRQSRSSLRSSPSLAARSQSLLFRPAFARAEASRQSAFGARWYSSEQQEVKKDDGEASAEKKDSSPEEVLKAEMEKKDKEIIDLKDRYLRSVAEFRNLQERTKRDMAGARDFAIQKFAKDLIESVDNFDRALDMVPKEVLKPASDSEANKDLIALYDGLKMTEGILMNTLKKHGLERFDPSAAEEKFNPNEHEATFMTPMPAKEDGVVFHTQSKGFKLNGRVLRAAKVGVVKNS